MIFEVSLDCFFFDMSGEPFLKRHGSLAALTSRAAREFVVASQELHATQPNARFGRLRSQFEIEGKGLQPFLDAHARDPKRTE